MIEAVLILSDETYNMPFSFPLDTPMSKIDAMIGKPMMGGRCTLVGVAILSVQPVATESH